MPEGSVRPLVTMRRWLLFVAAATTLATWAGAGRSVAASPADLAGPSPDAGSDAGAAYDAAPRDVSTADAAPSQPLPSRPEPPPIRVRASLIERGTRRPATRVSLWVDDHPVAADAGGQLELSLSPGSHMLQVHDPRYEDLSVPLTVVPPGGEVLVLRVSARRLPASFGTTVRARAAQEPAVTVAGEEARRAPGTSGDPFRVVPSLPGVSQIVWPLALFAIRGANPGNTGFFVDDLRVPALFHLALGPSIIHPYLISRLDFFPGGYPARYGGFVSGIVVAHTDAAPPGTALTAADVRLYDAGALVTRSFDQARGVVTASARYAYPGLLVGRLSPDVSFAYADYQLRIDHPLWGGRVTTLFLGSFDRLDLKTDQTGDAGQDFHRVQLRWTRAVGPGRLQFSATAGADRARSTLYGDDITAWTASVAPHLRYTLFAGRHVEIEAGTDGQWEHFQTTIAGDTGLRLGQSDLARTRSATVAGAYVSAAVKVTDGLNLVPAARATEYFEESVARAAIEPRLTARLRVSRAVALKAAVGRFAQMPSLPLGVAGFEGFGLADFGLQESAQASAGAEIAFGDTLSVDVTGFYQALRVSDLQSIFERTITASDFLQMRPGRAFGGELLVRRDIGHRLHGWLAYTLSWSQRSIDGVWGPSDWDQRHILNLLASYDLPRGWGAGLRFHYNSGRPYPVATSGFMAEYHRLPAFYQLDLRADKRWSFDRWWLEAYVELGNATLTNNVTSLTTVQPRPVPGAPPSPPMIEDVGFRLVLPAVGVHAEF